MTKEPLVVCDAGNMTERHDYGFHQGPHLWFLSCVNPRPVEASAPAAPPALPRPITCPRCHGNKTVRRDRQEETCGMCGGRGFIISEHEDLELRKALTELYYDTDHLDGADYLIGRTIKALEFRLQPAPDAELRELMARLSEAKMWQRQAFGLGYAASPRIVELQDQIAAREKELEEKNGK